MRCPSKNLKKIYIFDKESNERVSSRFFIVGGNYGSGGLFVMLGADEEQWMIHSSQKDKRQVDSQLYFNEI